MIQVNPKNHHQLKTGAKMGNMKPITGNLRAVQNRVIVSDMNFGEQVTRSGIVLTSDNGKTRGVHPRWCRVYQKGPKNKDPYYVGDWILVEHGRWTRGFLYYDDNLEKEITLRMVEAESVIMYSKEKPFSIEIGKEYQTGDTFAPEHFEQYQNIF